jgi:hypothetical protein
MRNNLEKPIVKASSIKSFIIHSFIPIGTVILAILGGNMELSFWPFFIAWEWIILIFVLNFYNFHEEYMEIFSPVRIGKKRRRKRYYSEIWRVTYCNPEKERSHIRIYGAGKKYRFSNYANTLYISFRKARQILNLLKSKGIPVEVIGFSERIEKKLWESD